MMNHRGTEDTEKKKKNDEISPRSNRLTILYILAIPLICGFLCYLLPMVNLAFHYAQWQLNQPETYMVELSYVGLIEIAELPYGKFDLSSKPQNYPDDEISYMFEKAIWCKFNPIRSVICRVSYHPQYGFPTRISWGFIEGGWIQAENFREINN